ncbi:ABC transporter permease subunit, partial [Turicibacter sanguinis]|nr:ABC transporter permease subunit [Turicibacter sanguinis]
FPTNPTLDNWVKLFKNPAGSWFLNSVYLSFFTMILVCVTSTLAGYVLGKKNFYGSKLMFAIFIGAMALPKQVILIPLVRIVSAWGFGDTLSAVILPAVGWPFGIFLMKQFSQTVPNELLESAKIDGCSEWGIFTKIVLPLVKPGVAALAIFTFISSWNDYFLQLIFLNSRSNLSLPLGVATMQQEFSSNYGVIMAGAALASLPMVIIFVFFQKYFTQGITMGAVKG